MAIEVTARHMHATPVLQEYAKGKAERLVQEFPRVEHVHVILDHQRYMSMAEVVVQAKPHVRVEAAESFESMVASIDAAMTKVERQMRKVSEKVRDRKPRKGRAAKRATGD